jgi:hypothetical protein
MESAFPGLVGKWITLPFAGVVVGWDRGYLVVLRNDARLHRANPYDVAIDTEPGEPR